MNLSANSRYKKSSLFFLWSLFFSFSTFSAIIFQKFLLPLFPEFHAGFGLLTSDSILFHEIANEISLRVHSEGWKLGLFWSSEPHMRGSVALLSLLYSLFFPDPVLIIPINAALHATAAIMIILIAQKLNSDKKIAWVGGIIAAIIFLILPSSLNWYAQVHRDGYSILGTLIILYSWIRFVKINTDPDYHEQALFLILNLLGIFLYWFARPYYLILITITLVVCLLLLLVNKNVRKKFHLRSICPVFIIFFILIFLSQHTYSEVYGKVSRSSEIYNTTDVCPKWQWKESEYIPDLIDRAAEAAAKSRRVLLCASRGVNSNVDEEIVPDSTVDVLNYLPRAMQISLFSPFPDTWFAFDRGILWQVGVSEIILSYIFFIGILIALFRRMSFEIIFALAFILTLLTFFGFTTANIGTLHRARYIFMILLSLIGILGWLSLIKERWKNNKKEPTSNANKINDKDYLDEYNVFSSRRKKMIKGGIIVTLLTAVAYFGFFIRDILMAYKFGFDKEFDIYFIAMLIPMFFVNIISMPFGEAIIPEYISKIKNNHRKAKSYVKNNASIITCLLAIITGMLVLFSTYIIDLFTHNFSSDSKHEALLMFYSALPILILSGLIIVGNSILNSHSKYNVSATYQLFPPCVSVLFLLLFGDSLGVLSVLIGMIVGQILNYIFVYIYLSKKDILLIPVFSRNDVLSKDDFIKQFFSLCLVSVFFQIIILINNGMASTLTYGSISALNIGLKFVFFVTSIIAVVNVMVILPYFTIHYREKRVLAKRNELVSFVIHTSIFSAIFSVLLYFLAEYIIILIFNVNNIAYFDVGIIINILKLGLIQIPFFTCLTLLIKFCIASKINKEILFCNTIGVIANIFLNIYFIKVMGVPGIALSTSLSVFLVASILLVSIRDKGDISYSEIFFILSFWVFFILLMLCLYNNYITGVIVCSIAMIINSFSMHREYSIRNKLPVISSNTV